MLKTRWILALFVVLSCNAKADHVPETDLETMVVTGQETDAALEAEIELIPGGVTLIDAEDLSERNVSNLADMLRYVPGVWSASHSGADSMFFSSRGSNLDATDYDMNGIKLLQDGLPVTTADGSNHNRMIDPLSARYATVARGANALQYGASTLGGAINFITPTAHNSPSGQFFFNSGGDGQTLGRATFSRVFNGGSDALVTVEAKQWDGYREHNEQERFGLYGNAGFELGADVRTRFYITHLDNRQELPSGLTLAQVEEDPSQANPSAAAGNGNFQIDVVTSRIANKTVWILDADSSLEAGLSHEEQTLFHPIVYAPPHFTLLVDTDHKDIGTVVNYRRRTGDHDFQFGFTYGTSSIKGGNYEHTNAQREDVMDFVDHQADSLELYAIDRWRFDGHWLLELAAQSVSASRDAQTTDTEGGIINPKDDYSSFNPRIGVTYALNADASLYANISSLYEPPTNFELADDARADGSALKAMQGAVVEFGSRGEHALGKASHWGWDISLYHAEIEDAILSVDDPANPGTGTSLSSNIDRTIHAGVEAVISAGLTLDSGDSVTPLLSVTVNDFSFDNDPVYGNNTLPAAPDRAVRGEILYRRSNGFYIGPTFDAIGERYADFVNTYKVDSYNLIGLRAGWSDEKWSAFLDIQNARDEEYIASHGVLDIANPDADILNPGAPQSVYFGIQMQH
jgi:iron complex outermembrane receptor protein